eukprot:3601325-Prymnesium_polylepis.2
MRAERRSGAPQSDDAEYHGAQHRSLTHCEYAARRPNLAHQLVTDRRVGVLAKAHCRRLASDYSGAHTDGGQGHLPEVPVLEHLTKLWLLRRRLVRAGARTSSIRCACSRSRWIPAVRELLLHEVANLHGDFLDLGVKLSARFLHVRVGNLPNAHVA